MSNELCQKCETNEAVAHCPICNIDLCEGCASTHLRITSLNPDAIERAIMNHILENMSNEERQQLINECTEELEERMAPLLGKKPTKDVWKEFIEKQGGTHRLR